ncbi:MAG: ankyrin repeat domain-containing protein [Bacteroidales bacterium]
MKKFSCNGWIIWFLAGFIGWSASAASIPQEPDLLSLVRARDTLAVKKLIAGGADLNVQDEMMGNTPLSLAVTSNQPGMVRILIDAGANINHRDKIYGYTPLMQALNSNYTEVAKILLEAGADIHIRGNNGATALMVAALNSQEMTKRLLEKGADITTRSENGTGVLTNCVMGIISGRVTPGLAEFLLSHGAEVDEVNTTDYYGGYTPLFWAVEDHHEELVRLLIRHGANVNARAADGKTPLSIAREAGHTGMVDILKTAGAVEQ